jgi:hypothetical protein
MKKILCLALPALLAAACSDSTEPSPDAGPDPHDSRDSGGTGYDIRLDDDGPAIDAPAIDSPIVDALDRDLPIITLSFPDGRTATVNKVASCDSGALYADPRCPATYADGLAKAMTVDSGVIPQGTAAGQCAEGSYVYVPYLGLESKSCYYGPDGTTLLAVDDCSDVTHECTAAPGTASNCWHHGTLPPCTNVTWTVQRWGYQ